MTLRRRSAMPCRPGPIMWRPSCAASRPARSSRRGSGGARDVAIHYRRYGTGLTERPQMVLDSVEDLRELAEKKQAFTFEGWVRVAEQWVLEMGDRDTKGDVYEYML